MSEKVGKTSEKVRKLSEKVKNRQKIYLFLVLLMNISVWDPVPGCFHHPRFVQGTFHPNVCTSVQLYHPTIEPLFTTSMAGQTVCPYKVLGTIHPSASMLFWHPYGGVRLVRLGRMHNTDPCFPVHPCFPMLPCFQVLPCFPVLP